MRLTRELSRWADPDAITVCPFVTPTVSIMSNFQLNDDDVVSMEASYAFTKTATSQVSELRQALLQHLSDFRIWIKSGVPCRVLKGTGGGWQAGKIYLRLEFIPDEPTPEPGQMFVWDTKTTPHNLPSPEPSNPGPTDAVLSPNPKNKFLRRRVRRTSLTERSL